MNELVTIHEKEIDGTTEKTVNARELWDKLEIETRFNDWITRRIELYGFIEGEDFYSNLSKSTGGRREKEYLLTLDTAKELAMVENNEAGKAVRKYFIAVEKEYWKKVREDKIQLESKIEAMLPKVMEYEWFFGSSYGVTLEEAARMLYPLGGVKFLIDNLKTIRLNDGERTTGLIKENGLPSEKALFNGYFTLRYKPNKKGLKPEVRITPKGIRYIHKRETEQVHTWAMLYDENKDK
jgi:phage anti-repressor protein